MLGMPSIRFCGYAVHPSVSVVCLSPVSTFKLSSQAQYDLQPPCLSTVMTSAYLGCNNRGPPQLVHRGYLHLFSSNDTPKRKGATNNERKEAGGLTIMSILPLSMVLTSLDHRKNDFDSSLAARWVGRFLLGCFCLSLA